MKNETVLKILSILITLFGVPLIMHFFFSFIEILFMEEIVGKHKAAIIITFVATIIQLFAIISDNYLLKFLKK